jgi:hypothetical protein
MFLTATAALAKATTYYVASSGNDAWSGLSINTPWASLAKASSVALQPGDRVLLKRGDAFSGTLKISSSGTSTSMIEISDYGTRSKPLPLLEHGGCIDVSGSYVTVANVDTHSCTYAGVTLRGTADHLYSSVTTNNVAGVYVAPGSTYAVVANNVIKDNNRMEVLTPTPTNDDNGAFGVLVRGDYASITQNTITGSNAFSYDYVRDGSAVEISGAQHTSVRYNMASNDNAFTELGDPRSLGNTYAYNTFWSSLTRSIFLVTRGPASSYGPVAGTIAYNNTAYETGSLSQGFVCSDGCSGAILRTRNNIMDALWKSAYADAPFDEDYDLFFGGVPALPLGRHSRVLDPLFVNPAGGDLHLRVSSPAIDSGVSLGYTRDLDKNFVPVDGNGDGRAAPDLGAYEHPAPPPCGAAAAPPAAWQHVIWIVFENKSYSEVIGSPNAPYINTMAAACGLARQFYAESHPSLPNYIAMTSGGTQGIADDAPPSSHPLSMPNIFSQLGIGGWRSLEDSMPSNCYAGNSGLYAVRHNPAAYYQPLADQCASQDVPLGSTADLSAPFTFITPDLCHDMHSSPCASDSATETRTGDRWLAGFLPQLLASSQYKAGSTAIFITWDESDAATSQRVPTLVISPSTPAGTVSDLVFNHYSMLRTTEEMLGLGLLDGAANAPSMRSAFGL